jgi:hypothetical protein
MEYIINYNTWKQIYEDTVAQETVAKEQLLSSKVIQLSAIAVDAEYWIDLAVDAVSGLIDLVPLIGTAISGAVDIIHALSYIFRAVLTSTTAKKIEYFLLGIVGIGTAFIPVGGNIANAAARIGISNALKLSPKVLTTVPLIKNSNKVTAWATSTPWKFDFLTVIIHHFKDEAIKFISEILATFKTVFDKIIPILKEWVDNWIVGSLANSLITGIKSLYYTINDFNSYAPIVKKAIDKIS